MTWYTIYWRLGHIQHLANIFPISLDAPPGLRILTTPWVFSTHPVVILVPPLFPTPCKPLLEHLPRSYPKPCSRNDFFPFVLSPTLSQTPSTPVHHQVSPEPSPTPKLSCRQATPVLNRTRGKWCCSVCDKVFRGKWECKRHIQATGKRSDCVACGRNLSARDDSLLRHFTIYCKGDVGNLSLEDAFVEVGSPRARKRPSW